MLTHKHLTLHDRITIEMSLHSGESFKAIGRLLNKDCTTISKEIRKHRVSKSIGGFKRAYNNCIHAAHKDCTQKAICPLNKCPRQHKQGYCWSCPMCNRVCKHFEPYHCPKLDKPPYVCNPCPEYNHTCTSKKTLYIASEAHEAYSHALSDSRTGISLSELELQAINTLIRPLIKQGQSLHHIATNHSNELTISERTLYKIIDTAQIDVRNIDLIRKVRMRNRKKPGPNKKIDRNCRKGRTMQDYLEYQRQHPQLPVRQMDTVIGSPGGPVLLTIHFVESCLQLAFWRERNTAQSVIDIIDWLYGVLGHERYTSLFPIILTDNGSEFSNPLAIEFSQDNRPRTRIFYCDPGQPAQKGSCENNHTFIRRYLPKGTDLTAYTQLDINLMMSHINNYTRQQLGDKSPYEVFSFLYGEELLQKLGINYIPPDKIILNQTIFNK